MSRGTLFYKTACVPSEDSDSDGQAIQSSRPHFEDTLDPWLPREWITRTLIRLRRMQG